jgi:putative endonuclease
MFYYTYILRSDKNGLLYTGFTTNLRKRLQEHNEGKSTYTKNRGPFKLVYYEACLSKKIAMSR